MSNLLFEIRMGMFVWILSKLALCVLPKDAIETLLWLTSMPFEKSKSTKQPKVEESK